MDIRLQRPDPDLRQSILNAAAAADCIADIGRCSPYHCTFKFLAKNGQRQADFHVQDLAIGELLSVYPDAIIRTARAVYESLSDFETQRKNRVS